MKRLEKKTAKLRLDLSTVKSLTTAQIANVIGGAECPITSPRVCGITQTDC